MKQRKIGKLSMLLAIVLLLSACYEDQEGCLDILAQNYDVTADNECEECCTYPSLFIKLTQNLGEEGLSTGDTIVNNLGDSIRLLDYVYFISNVSVTISDMQEYTLDSFLVIGSKDTVAITKDILRVSRTRANYEVGEFRTSGDKITSLHFDLGVPTIVNGAAFDSEADQDLTTDTDSLRTDDGQYIVQRLLLGINQEKSDTIVDVPTDIFKTSVTIPTDTLSVAGQDKTLEITVDYQNWFDDIDFEVDDSLTIVNKLKTNLTNCFQ